MKKYYYDKTKKAVYTVIIAVLYYYCGPNIKENHIVAFVKSENFYIEKLKAIPEFKAIYKVEEDLGGHIKKGENKQPKVNRQGKSFISV